MTHDELLAKIDHNLSAEVWLTHLGEALRAVVELHKPELMVVQSMCLACTNSLETVTYPCPTIKAIEEELA